MNENAVLDAVTPVLCPKCKKAGVAVGFIQQLTHERRLMQDGSFGLKEKNFIGEQWPSNVFCLDKECDFVLFADEVDEFLKKNRKEEK